MVVKFYSSKKTRKSKHYATRFERYIVKSDIRIEVCAKNKSDNFCMFLCDISKSGIRCITIQMPVEIDQKPVEIIFKLNNKVIGEPVFGHVTRIEEISLDEMALGAFAVALRFNEEQEELINKLLLFLSKQLYITDELSWDLSHQAPSFDLGNKSIVDYYRNDSPDLFKKCGDFQELISTYQQMGLFQSLYRVTLTSSIDNRITVYNPINKSEMEMLCFDFNSYLGLHKHPRVIRTIKSTMDHMGCGTPSSQMLSGTNKYLRELEETLCQFHNRESAVIFPSGYSANSGTITALIRPNDAIFMDAFSCPPIQDGCNSTKSNYKHIYPHLDLERLEVRLQKMSEEKICMGKLIVTDGLFNIHGKLAPLPQLKRLAKKYNAKLMMDDSHSTGVIGATGKGIEEHFNMPKSIDILVGGFSKTAGAIGGYVCGSKEMIDYLRFFARSAIFTSAIPASTCAGIIEAYKVIQQEPELRNILWNNINLLSSSLRNEGFLVPEPESAIITIFIGNENLLWLMSKDLFELGIKCGNASFPSIPRGQSLLRLTLSTNHTTEDIIKCLEVFKKIGNKYGILNKDKEEIIDIGNKIKVQ